MDHSVKSYIERRYPSELIAFLEMCMQTNQWWSGVLTVPLVLESLRKHLLNRREQMARDFDSNFVLKTAGILYVFQGFYKQKLGQKIRQLPKTI